MTPSQATYHSLTQQELLNGVAWGLCDFLRQCASDHQQSHTGNQDNFSLGITDIMSMVCHPRRDLLAFGTRFLQKRRDDSAIPANWGMTSNQSLP